LKSCIDNLLENTKRYPQDRFSIWKCLQKLGTKHPQLSSPLVAELLNIHPYLELTEPSLEDNCYIGLLMLVFNATATCTNIVSLFEHHTREHYAFLRDSYPALVPKIARLDNSCLVSRNDTDGGSRTGQEFLLNLFERFKRTLSSEKTSIEIQTAAVKLLISDLERFGEIESKMSQATLFLGQHLQCQMALRRMLSNSDWINAFLLSPLQASSFRSSLQEILDTSFKVIHQFHGAHPVHISLILQTRLKALALQLIAVIHGSNASALTLSEAFLEEVKNLENHLSSNGLQVDQLTASVMSAIGYLKHPKPGSIARLLQPLFLTDPSLRSQVANLVSFLSTLIRN